MKRCLFLGRAFFDRPLSTIRQVDMTPHIEKAQETAEAARRAREDIRRSHKPGSKDRDRVIEKTLRSLEDAMRPIRSAIGKIAWGGPEYDGRLREVSDALQYERKQLKKMRR